jgi:hypothetical protein
MCRLEPPVPVVVLGLAPGLEPGLALVLEPGLALVLVLEPGLALVQGQVPVLARARHSCSGPHSLPVPRLTGLVIVFSLLPP